MMRIDCVQKRKRQAKGQEHHVIESDSVFSESISP